METDTDTPNRSTGEAIFDIDGDFGEVEVEQAKEDLLPVMEPTPLSMRKNKSGAGRPTKFKTYESVQRAIDNYLEDDTAKPHCMSGLANRLGLSRQGLLEYTNKSLKISDAVKKARNKIEEEVEMALLSGKNPGGLIFNLTNNFGWVQPSQRVESKNENINTLTVYHTLTDEELELKLLTFNRERIECQSPQELIQKQIGQV